MIKLHQFARSWDIPNLSLFCAKIETYLRMVDIPYETVDSSPLRAPKGKLPFIKDSGKIITDSRFIVDYLKYNYGDSLDKSLTTEQRAVATAMQRLIEEHFFWIAMYTRWQYSTENWQETKHAIFGDLPPVARNIVALIYRRLIRKQIYGHGLGRHSSEEIFELGKIDVDVLSDFLGSKCYFMGKEPRSLDASAFASLINMVACPIDSPVKVHALSKTNLVDYCKRMTESYFPELGGVSYQ